MLQIHQQAQKQRKRIKAMACAAALGTETVEGTAGALECVDDVEGGDGLALCVLGVGDGVTDDLSQE